MASRNWGKKRKGDEGVQLLHNVKSARKEVISHPQRRVFEVYEREVAGNRVCVCCIYCSV